MKKDKRQLDMTQGNPAKLLVTFAIPMMLGAIFDLLYNMVDAIILGRYVSADALAAVGATTAITGMIVMIGFAFTQSISILIAQAFGAGDNAKLHHLVAQAFDLSLAVSVLLGAASIALAEPLAILLGVPENICGDSVLYIRIVCGMGIARMFYNTSAAVLRAIGDSSTPLYFLIISSVLNILLDIVFVVVFGMEIAGVAWATVIAQLLSAALCCAYMWKKYASLRFAKEDLKPDRKIQWSYIRIALPIALREFLLTGGQMMISGVINRFGSDVVAAYTVGGKVQQIAIIALSQIEASFAFYTGQNFGAGRFDRIRDGLKQVLILSGSITAICMMVMLGFGRGLALIFVRAEETDVLIAAVDMIRIEAIFLPAFTVICLYNSMLRGMGIVGPTLASSAAELISKVGFSQILSELFGYVGAWLASPLGWVVGLTISVGYYHFGNWKQRVLSLEEK